MSRKKATQLSKLSKEAMVRETRKVKKRAMRMLKREVREKMKTKIKMIRRTAQGMIRMRTTTRKIVLKKAMRMPKKMRMIKRMKWTKPKMMEKSSLEKFRFLWRSILNLGKCLSPKVELKYYSEFVTTADSSTFLMTKLY